MTFTQKAVEAAARAMWPNFDDMPAAAKVEVLAEAERCLTAALAVDGVATQGWQPIETAPINQAVLIKTNASDYYGNSGIYEAMLVDMGSGRRWHTFGYAVGRDLGADWMPTNWQRLPKPPAANDGEERR